MSTWGRNKELEKELKKLKETADKINKTKKSARAFLIKNGFITKGGKLTKRYR